MKRIPTALLALAVAAAAQAPPAKRTAAPAPTAGKTAPAAPAAGKTAAPAGAVRAPAPGSPAPSGPSYRDLKFPPLGPISAPQAEWSTLANGLRVLLLPDQDLPMLAGTLWVRTGNALDPADQVGLATVAAEAMRTGGIKARTPEQVDEALDSTAASIAVAVSADFTAISFTALRPTAVKTLEILRDILTAPEFRPEQVDRVKARLRDAILHRNDNLPAVVRRELANVVYGRSTSWGRLPDAASVARITRAACQDFHKRYFFPANAVLAIRGDFDATAMKSGIDGLFGSWSVEPQPTIPDFPPPALAESAAIHFAGRKEADRLYFAAGAPGVELRAKDHPALEVASAILGAGFESRVVQRLRGRAGTAYDVAAAVVPALEHPGLIVISGSAKPFASAETITAIREEAGLLGKTEVSEEELRKGRDAVLHRMAFALDTPAKMMETLLGQEYFGYPRSFLQDYVKALAAVTRADVLRVAGKYLDPSRLTFVALANPADLGKPLSSTGLPVTPLDLAIVAAAPRGPGAIERTTAGAGPRRTVPTERTAPGGAAGLPSALLHVTPAPRPAADFPFALLHPAPRLAADFPFALLHPAPRLAADFPFALLHVTPAPRPAYQVSVTQRIRESGEILVSDARGQSR